MKLQWLRGATLAAMMSLGTGAFASEQSSYVTPTSGPMSMSTFTASHLNPALRAIAACHNGSSAPANGPSSAPLTYQCWMDTSGSPSLYKIYDGAQWITLGAINTSSHLWIPYLTGGTSGGVPYFSAANVMSSSAALAQYGPVIGGGAGAAPSTITAGTDDQILFGRSGNSPLFRSVTGDVTFATGVSAIGSNKVTNAMLRPSGALAVVGRSANSTGNIADIQATAASDAVLRESGNALGFGTIATGGIANNAVTDAKLRPGTALSLIGRSANSSGNVADIAASAGSDCIFRESASTLGCGTLATAGLANNAVTNAKMASMGANTVKANATGSGANPTDVTPATARSSSLLNIDQATSTGDSNYTILATDRAVYHTALSAARTDTLPSANAVNVGQTLRIIDPRGVATASNTVTLQRAGSDTINGSTTFIALQAANGMAECISDGSSRWACSQIGSSGGGGVTSIVCNGVTITTSGTCVPAMGLTNHSLAVSASAGALTIALKDNVGNDPSASSPVNGYFRNAAASSTGSWTQLTVTSALSLTVSSGSTLGVTSSSAFRLWVVLFNDGGTARLGVINCADSTHIYPLTEYQISSSTAEGGAGAADSAGVFYTGAAVTAKAYLIVGFLEWSSSGLTAGTWTTADLLYVQSFGPGIRKPGEPVGNLISVNNGSGSSVSSASYTDVTGATATITPTSAANAVRVTFAGYGNVTASGAGTNSEYQAQLLRGATAIAHGLVGVVSAAGTNMQSEGFVAMSAFDSPNTASAATYKVQHRYVSGGTPTVTTTNVNLIVEEVMR